MTLAKVLGERTPYKLTCERSGMELNHGEDEPETTPASIIRESLARLRNGESFRKFSEKLHYNHVTLHRVESGREMMSDGLAKVLDDTYRPLTPFTSLVKAARRDAIDETAQKFIDREQSDAVRIQVFTSSVIPGLLQTEEYAWHLFRESMPWDSEQKTMERVAARLKRQDVFERDDPPLHWAIIDESAIKRPVGDDVCMCAQLEHLLKMSGRWGVTTQVLPFSQRAHSMMGGSLTLLKLKDGAELAQVESFKTGEAMNEQKQILQLAQLFDVARAKALPENDSMDLVRHYLKTEYGNEKHP